MAFRLRRFSATFSAPAQTVFLIKKAKRELLPVILVADPGVQGGFVWNDRYGKLHASPMPDTLPMIANLIRSIAPQFFLVEHFNMRPGTAVSAKLLRHCGHLEGIAEGLSLCWREAYPHVWMKEMVPDATSRHFPTKTQWKTHLLNVAQRLQPALFRPLRTKAERLQISDAVLLWHFAQRVRAKYQL